VRPSPGEPLRVLVAYQDKTLFDVISDPRLEIQRSFDPSRPPRMIVLPCSRLDRSFIQTAHTLPPEAWRDVAVVFDGSAEGQEPPGKYIRRMQRFIAERGLEEERCAFVTQNRRLNWRELRVRIFHYDYWFRRLFSWSEANGEDMFERGLERFHARPGRRPKRYLSLNFTARREKLLFLLSLLRDGLWDQGHISFGGFEHLRRARGWSLDDTSEELLRTPGFEDLAADLVGRLPELDAKGQILFGKLKPRQDLFEGARKPLSSMIFAEFDQSWFSATTETEMAVKLDRVTEKSFKALLNFHPQVVLGNPGTLARLKAFGFESFAGEIEESYDQEPDPRRRFDMAYREIVRLCRMDEDQLRRLEHRLSDVLIANARWGLIGFPREYPRKWDPEIVSSLLELVPARP
jgi:hypothetical protein